MALKELNLQIKYCGKEINQKLKELVEKNHYSKTARSQMQVHVFELSSNNRLVGCAIFGRPMSRHYDLDTLELRRFVLVEDMPKNTESYFLSKCLKWIEKNDRSIVRIVTFADPNHGHQGTIYKATNFSFDGEENHSNPRVLLYDKKHTHMRSLYAKKRGTYTPTALKFQELVRSGKAKILKQEKKLRYMYYMRK